jgi:hypothetical protein
MLTIILAALLFMAATEAKNTGARKKKARQCRKAKKDGPIENGQKCKKVGLECSSTMAACRDYFDETSQKCVDTYLPCECRKIPNTGGGPSSDKKQQKSWSCAMARCVAPDERCTCDNPDLVGSGQTCYKEGLECPNHEGIVTCYGVWDEATEACTNVTVTPPCSCNGGNWICAFADCARPDPRCS